VRAFFGDKGIEWRFICERAPWWGGFYEALVKSVKTPLKKILGMSLLQYDELETLLKEVEGMLNSRPLTYVYNDQQEPDPLTPSHFIIGRRINLLPPITSSTTQVKDEPPEQLVRRARYRDKLLNSYWQSWSGEYFQQLSNSSSKAPSSRQPVRRGEVVVLHDDNLPRHKWKLAVIEKVYPATDGVIRKVKVKTQTGSFNRAVDRLHPLEVCAEDPPEEEDEEDPAETLSTASEPNSEEEDEEDPAETPSIPSETNSEEEESAADPTDAARGEDVVTPQRTRRGRIIRPNRNYYNDDFVV